MKENNELQLAWNFVNNTNRNVFLTGKAGTGKTTFLYKLKRDSQKRMIVVAPTGVAAINAKGVTIHSFFQLPFGPILPNSKLDKSQGFIRKFSKSKINLIKSLDLLVIDEISMVRADLLDGIDKTLRRYRDKDKVFGGVQLLMIGDLQQLSPVVNDNDWYLLQTYYRNIFFFSSISYNQCNAITIELKHIYRQNDDVFINILNEIRNNKLSQSSAELLNNRFIPNSDKIDESGYIFLTTHNHKAHITNEKKLNELKGEKKVYNAIVEGNFPENSYPNSSGLQLKVGAQVMFIKNDSSPEKRYFNGKIGKVILLDDDEVVVHCSDDDFNIVTKLETWENIKYSVDTETNAVKEDIVGSYSQIPLRLAWAITIHKSQGLTFEKAIIDAEDAFVHGQTYVALSRCKSLEGLILNSKIHPNQIISDSNVISFNENTEANQPDDKILLESKRQFQLDLISDIFNFYDFLYPTNRILDIYYKNRSSIEGKLEEPILTIKETITSLLKISHSFNSQLNSMVNLKSLPEEESTLQKRFKKAIEYFTEQTKNQIEINISSISFTTDNKALDKDISKHLESLEELLTVKLFYFENLKEKFNSEEFLKLRAKAVFLTKEQPKKQRKQIIEGTKNVVLFELLRELRHNIATRENLPHFQIFTQKSLYAMCELLPTNKKEMKAVHGMGKTRIDKYGDEILEVILEFINDNGIEITNTVALDNEKPKRQRGDSKKESLKLFNEGKSIPQIADIRELNESTIFGHLASYISSGKVKITNLMSLETYNELKEIIPNQNFENLSDLRHQLDEKYSYGELRLVLNELSAN